MSRQRVVVAGFGSHRVVCNDGTVWVERSPEGTGAPVGEGGRKQWVQVMDEIPDAPAAPRKKA